MAQPYVGEIRLFAGTFAPAGWMLCDGQLLPISENETLFNLIGTTYGGDGQTTFAVPNLCGRTPIHMGQGAGLSNRVIGENGGTETVTVTTQQIPTHTHFAQAQLAAANHQGPGGNVWATSTLNLYGTAAGPNATMNGKNLQGRVPLHVGSGFNQGQTSGEENHTLSVQEIPAHNHVPAGNSGSRSGTVVVKKPIVTIASVEHSRSKEAGSLARTWRTGVNTTCFSPVTSA